MTVFVGMPDALAVARALGFHVRDAGLLSSALARPESSMFGVEAYPELEIKAAALLSSLALNHPLFDGNKRFSWIITLTFLELNDVVVTMPNDAAFDLILATAQSEASLEHIAAEIRVHPPNETVT